MLYFLVLFYSKGLSNIHRHAKKTQTIKIVEMY
jgi:hypothetical protein